VAAGGLPPALLDRLLDGVEVRRSTRHGHPHTTAAPHRSPARRLLVSRVAPHRQRRLPPNLLELWQPFRQQYASRLVQLELRHLHAPWARVVQQVRGAPPRRPLRPTRWRLNGVDPRRCRGAPVACCSTRA